MNESLDATFVSLSFSLSLTESARKVISFPCHTLPAEQRATPGFASVYRSVYLALIAQDALRCWRSLRPSGLLANMCRVSGLSPGLSLVCSANRLSHARSSPLSPAFD